MYMWPLEEPKMAGCLLLPFKLVFVVLKLAFFLVVFVMGLALLPFLILFGIAMLLKAIF
jgi:hypothetical protein